MIDRTFTGDWRQLAIPLAIAIIGGALLFAFD